MQMIKHIVAASALLAGSAALADVQYEQGQASIDYTGKSVPPAVRAQAIQAAELKAIQTYYAKAGGSESANFDRIKDKVTSNLDQYVLDETIIEEQDRKDVHEYTVSLRAKLDVSKLENALKAASGHADVPLAAKSRMTFLVVARQASTQTDFDAHTYQRVDLSSKAKGATAVSENTTEGESVSKSQVSTNGSKSVAGTAEANTSVAVERGGSTTRKASETSWRIFPSANMDQVLTGAFHQAGFRVTEATDVEPYSGGKLHVVVVQEDYQSGKDLKSQTLQDVEAGLRNAKIPYLTLGTLDIEAIATRSKGTVSNFKLVSLVEPTSAGQPYKANIEASIAKFTAPADSKKLKIVLSPIRFSTNEFDVGGIAVPASKIAGEVRQRLIDALTATGRFSVLDRDFGPGVQSELDLVASGQTPSDEMAKLSQTLSADIVWVGTLNDFGYHRNTRHLEMAGRDLVSYSGGWSVSQRILNVSTRQIMLSDTLQDELAPTEPTTMGRGVDGAALAAKMESEIVDRTVSAILLRTFPLVVISKDGTNVILSQGGQAVKVGSSYTVVSLGKELKDPQTSESLGRTETPCCDVVIDRVSSKLAYGHLENVKIDLGSIDPVALQVQEEIRAKTLGGAAAATTAPQSAPASPASLPKAVAAQANPPAMATADSKNANDTKKW